MKAVKQTVSLTVNGDLVQEAKRLKIDVSQVVEALTQEVSHRSTELIASEIKRDLEACDAYTAKHGSFAETVRGHYADDDDEK